MTTVPRRTKPQPRSVRPAGPGFTAKVDPWPSYCDPTPRETTTGKVSSLPSPVQAMWAEAVGRQRRIDASDCDWDEGSILGGEVKGLVVAIAILSCSTIEDVYTELERRAHVAVSSSGRGS